LSLLDIGFGASSCPTRLRRRESQCLEELRSLVPATPERHHKIEPLNYGSTELFGIGRVGTDMRVENFDCARDEDLLETPTNLRYGNRGIRSFQRAEYVIIKC